MLAHKLPVPTSKPEQDNIDVICVSHLRWDFVYQRPQHLMSLWAKKHRVFFFEEAILDDRIELEVTERAENLWVAKPHFPAGLDLETMDAIQRWLIDGMIRDFGIERHILWYYAPMARGYTRHLDAEAIVYDCMDELAAFQEAPEALKRREKEILHIADIVFTGGHSLYEAKRTEHPFVHAFPSSVDVGHFAKARTAESEPMDQAEIPGPKIGYCGVIDERMDLDLLRGIAEARPEWHLVMLGPVVKIKGDDLPASDNIHYLGAKEYQDLPGYLSGWDVAILPFLRNESTRYISPTKTPEYLAAGRPAVSTSIKDVVRTYGKGDYVRIADSVDGFVQAIEEALAEDTEARLARVDHLLKQMSWANTWHQMHVLVKDILDDREAVSLQAQALVSGGSRTNSAVDLVDV